jgi:hypothetical protein
MTRTQLKVDTTSIRTEIQRFKSLDLESLRIAWRSKFKREGKDLPRDILLRMLVWRIQEKSFGGYDRATEAVLHRYAGSDGNLGGDGNSRHVQTGTVLVREYQGARHTVTVVPNGFIWREKEYSNLTKIAQEITGVKWNGPRFFGLRQARKTEVEGRASLA